ncbi:MAG: hypothetical protein ACXVMS_15515 [Flavisolibacter sp.]
MDRRKLFKTGLALELAEMKIEGARLPTPVGVFPGVGAPAKNKN